MGSRHAAKAALGTKSDADEVPDLGTKRRVGLYSRRAGSALGLIQETGLPDADAALEVLIPRRLIADPASFSKPSARASPGVGPSLP
jgi:hypothetical protein